MQPPNLGQTQPDSRLFSSVGTDATAVSRGTPADEDGFKVFQNDQRATRESYQSSHKSSLPVKSTTPRLPQSIYHPVNVSPHEGGDTPTPWCPKSKALTSFFVRLQVESRNGILESYEGDIHAQADDHVQFADYNEEKISQATPKLGMYFPLIFAPLLNYGCSSGRSTTCINR